MAAKNALAEGDAEAALDPRREAILDYAAKLTRDPAAIGPADAAPLRAQGLTAHHREKSGSDPE